MKNKYAIVGNTIEIYINSIHGDCKCIIGKDDFDKVCNIKTSWYLVYNKNRIESVTTKIQRNGIRKSLKLHQLILGKHDGLVIDHIDGNVLNNKKSNLRIITANENNTNIKDNHKSISGYQNIYIENGKYSVRINRKRYGRYNTLEEAILIRNKVTEKEFPLRTIK